MRPVTPRRDPCNITGTANGFRPEVVVPAYAPTPGRGSQPRLRTVTHLNPGSFADTWALPLNAVV